MTDLFENFDKRMIHGRAIALTEIQRVGTDWRVTLDVALWDAADILQTFHAMVDVPDAAEVAAGAIEVFFKGGGVVRLFHSKVLRRKNHWVGGKFELVSWTSWR